MRVSVAVNISKDTHGFHTEVRRVAGLVVVESDGPYVESTVEGNVLSVHKGEGVHAREVRNGVASERDSGWARKLHKVS